MSVRTDLAVSLGVGMEAKQILADGIPAAIAPGARYIDPVNFGLTHAAQIRQL